MSAMFAPGGTASTAPSSTFVDPTGQGFTSQAQLTAWANGQSGAANSAAKASTAAGNNASNNPAINPTLPNSTVPGSNAANAAAPNTYGTASGPGIMQQWFDERANGTDPGYEYATGRGETALNNQYAARGQYDSGAATQGQSDYLTNMGSQREAQLDSLAGQASTENQNQTNTMLGLGMGLAGGQAGLGSTYDTSGANAMSAANSSALNLGTQAATIPYLAQQNTMNNLFGAATKLL